MIFRKSIILNSLDASNKKAVINLEKDKDEVKGNVRLYNFSGEPAGILSIGIMSNKKVFKSGLTQTGNNLYSFGGNYNIDFNNFTCAVVNTNKAKSQAILLGSNLGTTKTDEALIQSFGVFDAQNASEIQTILDENNINLEDEKEVNKEIDSVMCKNDCCECVYKQEFYKGSNEVEIADIQTEQGDKKIDEAPKETIPYKDKNSFISQIDGQLSEFFKKYPEEKVLANIIPNSKWVKIEYENEKNYYVLGLIYEDNVVKYICYGVPGTYQTESPKDLGDCAQWLPIEPEKPEGYGYWLTYQDAQDGDCVKIEII